MRLHLSVHFFAQSYNDKQKSSFVKVVKRCFEECLLGVEDNEHAILKFETNL